MSNDNFEPRKPDPQFGTYEDEFVSEALTKLNPLTNKPWTEPMPFVPRPPDFLPREIGGLFKYSPRDLRSEQLLLNHVEGAEDIVCSLFTPMKVELPPVNAVPLRVPSGETWLPHCDDSYRCDCTMEL